MQRPSKKFIIGSLAAALLGCGSPTPPSPDGSAGSAGAPSAGGGTASGGSSGSGGSGPAGGGVPVGGVSGTGGGVGVSGGGVGVSGGGVGVSGGGGSSGAAGAPGTAFYVSPNGSDEAAGTESAPFKSIGKARDAVRTVSASMAEDIHVYLRAGTYSLSSPIVFGAEDSASNGHRIFYEAYPGEKPVLSGAVRVTGWAPHTGGVYKAPLDRKTKLRNLYVNDARASMTSKTVQAQGSYGTYSVTAGQAAWAWKSGSGADGVKYQLQDVPEITSNQDDLEIVNGTTWNENIVCVRGVVTTPDNHRALLLQQPYGAIAQLPGWSAGFSATGTHKIFNALELLKSPGQFYFDKTTGTLYYYPRAGEDMATADVQAPVVETLLEVKGTSKAARVKGLGFRGLTFQNTDYSLYAVGESRGKATVQGATVYVAYGDGNWHNGQYEITDTLPAMITLGNADGISIVGSVIQHGGSEGIALTNDVVNSEISGNYIGDMAGSGITVGHPQHVYAGDGGTHAKFAKDVEGVCTKNTITNNVLHDVSSLPGFGGHAGVTAFFVDTLVIRRNHIQTTAYNGINLGWGWRNFPDSTTCKNNSVDSNRLIDTLSRLHDSGAIYTLGQMPGTTINENYVKGIPPATTGPTYGLHNDEGSAYITENDNVLDIDPGVKYTINCEDFGAKHDLTIRRTHATVSKMGVNPPSSTIDAPVAVPDNVWKVAQYETCLASGVEDAYRSVLPEGLLPLADYMLPASVAAARGGAALRIRSSGSGNYSVWLAPAKSATFQEGPSMTKAAGEATTIALPSAAGSYRLHVLDADGKKLGESASQVRVE